MEGDGVDRALRHPKIPNTYCARLLASCYEEVWVNVVERGAV